MAVVLSFPLCQYSALKGQMRASDGPGNWALAWRHVHKGSDLVGQRPAPLTCPTGHVPQQRVLSPKESKSPGLKRTGIL